MVVVREVGLSFEKAKERVLRKTPSNYRLVRVEEDDIFLSLKGFTFVFEEVFSDFASELSNLSGLNMQPEGINKDVA